MKNIPILLLFIVMLSACAPSSDSRHIETRATESAARTVLQTVGMPKIKNFTEFRNAKFLAELRDQADISTYSYVLDMNGQLHHICDSIGYGINASIQVTNPMKRVNSVAMPQREPNMLFSPQGLESTFVMCIYKGETKVMYVEDRVLTSPFKLRAVDSMIIGYDVNAK